MADMIGTYAARELREFGAGGATAEDVAKSLRSLGFTRASRPLVEKKLRKFARRGAVRLVEDDGEARFFA